MIKQWLKNLSVPKSDLLSTSAIAEHYIHSFAYVGIVFDIAYGCFALFTFGSVHICMSNLVSAILMLTVIFIRKQGYISRILSENILVAICYCTLIFIILRTGGISSPVIPWFVIINSVALTLINKKNAFLWTLFGLGFAIFLWVSDTYFVKIPNDFEGKYFNTYIFTCLIGLLFLSLMITYVIDSRNDIHLSMLNKQNEELKANKAEIERLQKYKEQFLAGMTHELRTPLNAIKGIAQLLEETHDTDERNQLMDGLKKSSDHLLVVVNDILDFSKLNVGKLPLNKKPFILKDTIQAAYSLLKINADAKGLELKLQINKLPHTVMGDSGRLMQILVNVIGNAIKFTDKGEVCFTCDFEMKSSQVATVVLSVKDTGIGIHPEKKRLIFEDYSQADETIAAQFGGTGLGLGITKKLVELHDGDISCESVLGEGTVFNIHIPYMLTGESVDTQTPVLSLKTLEWEGTILIADDNRLNILVAEKLVQKALPKARVHSVDNGQKAVAFTAANKTDLILMDMLMPQMDGKQATLHIRSNKNIYQPKIIALTANTAEQDIRDCIEVGMDDFLSKPFYKHDLLSKIAKLVSA